LRFAEVAGNPRNARCFADQDRTITSLRTPNLRVESITVHNISIPRLGDHSVAQVAALTASATGGTAQTVSGELIGIQDGRVLVSVATTTFGTQTASSMTLRLARLVVSRLRETG
jgi:hypothetical protein